MATASRAVAGRIAFSGLPRRERVRHVAGVGARYLTLTQDVTRVMNRIKAAYRGRGIACASQKV